MTNQQIKALQYIKNTNGGATKEIFLEDHEPIGLLLWNNISEFVIEDSQERLWLTDEGLDIIQENRDA